MLEETIKSIGKLVLEDSDLAHKLFTAPLVPKQGAVMGAIPQAQIDEEKKLWTVEIKVKQLIPSAKLDADDRAEDPSGTYDIQVHANSLAEAEKLALDEFHETTPIAVLDDFEITTKASPAVKKEAVQEQSKPVVEAEGRMAQELDSNERNRPKKLDSIVAKAEKAASSGHWLARYRGIAEAAGKAKLARVFSHLQDIFDIAGHMPSGLQTLADEMADTLGYRLVQDGWTRKDLERIAWGLPLDFLDSAGVERPSGGRAEKENR